MRLQWCACCLLGALAGACGEEPVPTEVEPKDRDTTEAVAGLQNPIPVVEATSPGAVAVGDGPRTLAVVGTGLIETSVVRWNGEVRPTALADARRLQATITAADVAMPGTASITVQNPAPGGGVSSPWTLPIVYAAPRLLGISPDSIEAGGAAFPLTTLGSGFTPASVVRWRLAGRPTTFVNNSTLTATVGTADIAEGGTYTITVVNPAPGGGTSSGMGFTVLNPVPTVLAVAPDTIAAGSPGATLTITGTGFAASAEVLWNTMLLPRTWLSATQMTAALYATSLDTPGTFTVRVRNPSPGGGDSPPLTVVVR